MFYKDKYNGDYYPAEVVPQKVVTMIHHNHVYIDDDKVFLDRKFHDGMNRYVSELGPEVSVITINPRLVGDPSDLDVISVPIDSMKYELVDFVRDSKWKILNSDFLKLRKFIASSDIVYGIYDKELFKLVREENIPYINILEHDPETRVQIKTIHLQNTLSQKAKGLKVLYSYYAREMAVLKNALMVHCNGIPSYQSTEKWNENRLLYFDTRFPEESLIDKEALEKRLEGQNKRSLKLFFSGRFIPIKGATDVIKTAIECLKSGHDIELHCFGGGSDQNEMEQLINNSGYADKLHLNAPVQFPELIKLAKTMDLFVCCHKQGDPSCTYLETFGAGVPIVGYANKMWSTLCEKSQAGITVPIGDYKKLASEIIAADNNAKLATYAHNALAFAKEHTFEKEHMKRINSLKSLLFV